MTFAPGFASLMLLSLPIADLPADQIKVGAALVCDTEQQVERFVALYHGDTATAVSGVNAEGHDPSACGMASMAYVVPPPLATVRTKHATFQIVRIIVLGLLTDKGVRPVKPALFFSAMEVDERVAARDRAARLTGAAARGTGQVTLRPLGDDIQGTPTGEVKEAV
jgi:hypothetical protein